MAQRGRPSGGRGRSALLPAAGPGVRAVRGGLPRSACRCCSRAPRAAARPASSPTWRPGSGRRLHTVSCHDDLTAADLTGRYLLKGGETVWLDGPLTRAVREGGICYLDEVVEARKDVTVVLHPLTDDRRALPLERTGELLAAPDEFMLVVSYNPGYQNILKSLKPSTRQRFVAIELDFPRPEIELRVVAAESGLEPERVRPLINLAVRVRELKGMDLEEAASTRLLVYAATLIARRHRCRRPRSSTR